MTRQCQNPIITQTNANDFSKTSADLIYCEPMVRYMCATLTDSASSKTAPNTTMTAPRC